MQEIAHDKAMIDLTQPVLKQALGKEDFISALNSSLATIINAPDCYSATTTVSAHECNQLRHQRNNFITSIKLFSDFLTAKKILHVQPTESILKDFSAYLREIKPDCDNKYLDATSARIRKLINAFPAVVLNRPLANDLRMRSLTRYDHLNDRTREAVLDFLKDGRKTRRGHDGSVRVLTSRLSDSYRSCVVESVCGFLKVLGKNDVFTVVAGDVDKYLQEYDKRGRRQTAEDRLAEVRPFFDNLFGTERIATNPCNSVQGKKITVSTDFIPPEHMEKLQDLSTVDMGDVCSVRDRLLCFGLAYDFALRLGEIVHLQVQDISIKDHVEMLLRGDYQKGQNKSNTDMFSYFPETKMLMTKYLELRTAMSPQTDALIVSDQGGHLLETGCRLAMNNECKRLGIVSDQGKRPHPHLLRHSFGTLNINELGLGLGVYAIMIRLRHTSLAVTTKVYINGNKLLARKTHDVQVQKAFGTLLTTPAGIDINSPMSLMDEDSAVLALETHQITRKSLRKHGLKNGYCKNVNGKHVYAKDRIQSYARDYYSKPVALRMIGFNNTGFFTWRMNEAIEPVYIGAKVCLIDRRKVEARMKKR